MIARMAPLLVLTGCLQALGPDVGPLAEPMMPTCAPDSNAAVVTTFTAVRDVFRAGDCLECHTGDGLGIRQSGLDLEDYASLRTGGGRSGVAIVVDGDPCGSILVQKIELSPPFGRRMPYDGPPYLTDAEILLVRDWIAEGAHDN